MLSFKASRVSRQCEQLEQQTILGGNGMCEIHKHNFLLRFLKRWSVITVEG